MNLLVLGPQGSGKGTQAARISADHGIPHVSTGEMFRAAIAEGRSARPAGRAVPRVGRARPRRADRRAHPRAPVAARRADGFVLDGFPRNRPRPRLDEMLAEIGRSLDAVLFFDIPDEVALERASPAGRPRRVVATTRRTRSRGASRSTTSRPSRSSSATGRPGSSCRCMPSLDRRGRGGDRRGARAARRGRGGVIIRKSPAEIDRIAAAGAVVAETIAHVGERIEPGITTLELDRIAGTSSAARAASRRRRAIAATARDLHLGERGRRARDPGRPCRRGGDLVTIDVGVTLDGAIADSAYTFGIGSLDAHPDAQRLLDTAQDALAAGIAEAPRQPDRRHLARGADRRRGRRLLGRPEPRRARRRPSLPRGPARPELRRARRAGPRLSEGMTIAIEPMITAGSPEVWLEDGWTISTEDGSLSAPSSTPWRSSPTGRVS